ncbi:MAG: four helix bundle protein [Acidobacteriia bacterium]|nr:four helix bundle protein [Terriglobia bacterium]
MTVHRFEDLKCWQEARELTKLIYGLTKSGGIHRDFGLRDQMRRASVSIMANIAEGFQRRADREFVQFLQVAMASASEIESHLYVALDQGYIAEEQFSNAYQCSGKTGKMISALIKYLRSHPKPLDRTD